MVVDEFGNPLLPLRSRGAGVRECTQAERRNYIANREWSGWKEREIQVGGSASPGKPGKPTRSYKIRLPKWVLKAFRNSREPHSYPERRR